jgi:hypothetical protein
MHPNATPNRWKAPLAAAIVAGLTLVVLAGVWMQTPRPALPVYSVPPATEITTPLFTAVVGTTATAGYSVEGLRATAEAVERILPTASPNPSLPVGKAERFQSTDIWQRAYATAIALYPAPPDYFPPDLLTPVADPPPRRPSPSARPAPASSTMMGGVRSLANRCKS